MARLAAAAALYCATRDVRGQTTRRKAEDTHRGVQPLEIAQITHRMISNVRSRWKLCKIALISSLEM